MDDVQWNSWTITEKVTHMIGKSVNGGPYTKIVISDEDYYDLIRNHRGDYDTQCQKLWNKYALKD